MLNRSMAGVSGFVYSTRGGKLHCFAFMYIHYSSKTKNIFLFRVFTLIKIKKNKIFGKLNKKAEVISPG